MIWPPTSRVQKLEAEWWAGIFNLESVGMVLRNIMSLPTGGDRAGKAL